ncbi:MAG: PAS domain S-box protein [Nitrospira sp.]|jgi:PAS domain S-box-containing protein|nr:PAS domain S-box protein [Nitrospira sp.]
MSRTDVLEELESMRTQVSELTRELAERDRTIDDLRNIMDTVPDFLFTLDHGGQLIKWNRRAVEATGYTPQELFHKPALDFVPEEEQDRTAAAIRQAFTEGYAELDGHLLTKGGRRIPYHWTGAALKNSQGNAIGITGMGRDVSEQKRAEEEHRALFDQSPLMCFLIDTDGTLQKVNRQGAMALGYEADELLGQSILTLFPEEHHALAMDHIAACIIGSGSALASWELEKQRKDGSRLWVKEFTRVMTDRYGRPTLLISCEDITDRIRAEHMLRLSQFTIDHAVDAIYWIDPQAKIIRVNKAAGTILGYSEEELCTMTVHDLNPAFPEAIWPSFWAESKQRKTLTIETTHRHKQGHLIPVEIQINYLAYEGQEFHCAFVRDITNRKQAEDVLRHREQDLRKVLDEREQLSQNLHDGILQSLYAIGLGLESCKPLMRHRKHGKVSELLEQAIGQMNRVMGEIRNFIAGLDSGMLSEDTFSSALHAVIHAITATQPLHCTVTIDDAAAGRLSTEQALHLVNIVREALSNSLRHGRATKASVSLKQLAHSLRLCVSENGHGFNPPSVQGVGNGLTNMAARAHKIGARFSIRSAHDRGTRILVNLP